LNAIAKLNPFWFNEWSGKLSLGLSKDNLFFITTLRFCQKSISYGPISFQLGFATDLNDMFKRKNKLE